MNKQLLSTSISLASVILLSGCVTSALIDAVDDPVGPPDNTVYRYDRMEIDEDSLIMKVDMVAATPRHRKKTVYNIKMDLAHVVECQQHLTKECRKNGIKDAFVYTDELTGAKELVIELNHHGLEKDKQATKRMHRTEQYPDIGKVMSQQLPTGFYDDSFFIDSLGYGTPWGEISFAYKTKGGLLKKRFNEVRVIITPLKPKRQYAFLALVPVTIAADALLFWAWAKANEATGGTGNTVYCPNDTRPSTVYNRTNP